MDAFKSFAQSASSAVRSAASQARSAAGGAVRDVRATAAVAMGGSSALQAVGTVVVVSGRSFLIESLLAEGGFGSVYTVSLASSDAGAGGAPGAPRSSGSGAKFVLKRMFAGSPELAKQLTAEVALMQRLQGHPNIVKVRGSGLRSAVCLRAGVLTLRVTWRWQSIARPVAGTVLRGWRGVASVACCGAVAWWGYCVVCRALACCSDIAAAELLRFVEAPVNSAAVLRDLPTRLIPSLSPSPIAGPRCRVQAHGRGR